MTVHTTRWLVTGAGGMLASDLVPLLEASGDDVVALGIADLDITDAAAVADAVAQHRPDVVVNTAAWTRVDDAETHEPQALAVNGHGPANLAAACARGGALMVQLSTDYVFRGDATEPYAEDAAPDPATAYGRTKLAGEVAVLRALPSSGFVVRTAWLYGAGGPNFVTTMLRLERKRDTVDVVDDQVGQPTWTLDVADRVVRLARAGLARQARPGVYHATSSGRTTWCGFARAVFELAGADPERVRPVRTADVPRPAPRPAWSVLAHDGWSGTGIEPIGPWAERLAVAFPALSGRKATPRSPWSGEETSRRVL